MNPEDLSPFQLLITTMAGLFFSALFVGSMLVHGWVLVAWKRVMVWSGWLRDQVHDRIGLIDLLGCFACIAVSQIAVAGLFFYEVKSKALGQETLGPGELKDLVPESPWFMLAVSFSLVLGCVLSAFWTCLRTRRTPKQLGMWSGLIPRDLLVGALVFLWIIPLVLTVNIAVTQATQIEYQHPVIDSLREKSWAFPLLFTSAVICAPFWEEYAFRFLLVNWLETIRRHGFDLKRILFGFRPQVEALSEVSLSEDSSEDSLSGPIDGQEESSQVVEDRYPPWWVAISSGLIFGLAHFEYGVSWVPLVVLGTVLARVYQFQRSILPCFLIHAVFNSLAMIGFAVELFIKTPK